MFNVLQRFLTGDTPPTKVLEIKIDTHENVHIIHRDNGMIMYAPPSRPIADKKCVYEIAISRPFSDGVNGTYSLYRGQTKDDVEEKFNAFVQRLPIFVHIAKEMFNVNGLQKICDALIENPSWSIAHLVAYFNLNEYVSNPKVLDLIDYPDHNKLMTPFQLAIQCNNLDMVKTLLPLANVEYLDNKSNSIFHYAASTTKEIINVLAARSALKLNHCNADGYTPLHLACMSDKPDCVKALLLAGADVNIAARNINAIQATNNAPINGGSVAEFLQANPNKLITQDMKRGGTPLHWASSRVVLLELIERGCNVNALNFEGKTALHIMVERCNLECVVALLSHEAEIDILDDSGRAPLHIAIEKKSVSIVQVLVVFGCNLNLLNNEGKLPRHMVGKEASGGKEDMILYILHSVGASRCQPTEKKCPEGCNANGLYNGIPPEKPQSSEQREHIHEVLAATSKSSRSSITSTISNIVTSQIIQNEGTTAPPTIVDVSSVQKGQSVMDYILKAKQYCSRAIYPPEKPVLSEPMGNLIELEGAAYEPMEVVPQAEPNAHKRDGRLLCMDGGGIRGLILAQMLLEVETISATPIQYLFDWVAGTSTGGILALALATGKTMKQCMCLYLRLKDQAFVGSRPYVSDNLESLLKEALGDMTVMTDIVHPKLMITGVLADRKPVDLHFFRNYQCASEILGIITPTKNRRDPPPKPEDQLIWKAARATGAAPSYFRSFGRFLDGGLIANNPTLDAMTEIHEYNMALRSVCREKEAIPLSIVVSLGTGLIPVTELKAIDVFRPDSILEYTKLAYGISAIGNLLVDQATASDGRVVDRARAWCSMISVPYFRFNPQLSEDIAMDEKNDEKLVNMLWETKAYMYANRNKLIEMINDLR